MTDLYDDQIEKSNVALAHKGFAQDIALREPSFGWIDVSLAQCTAEVLPAFWFHEKCSVGRKVGKHKRKKVF